MMKKEASLKNFLPLILFLIALVIALAGFAISFSSSLTAILLLGIAGILFIIGIYASSKRKKEGSE